MSDELPRDPELSGLLRAHLSAPPLRSGFHDELEARLEALPTLRRRVTRWPSFRRPRVLAAAAVAIAAAVVAIVAILLTGGTSTATAADVVAAMAAAGRETHPIALDMAIRSEAQWSSDDHYSYEAELRLVLDTEGNALSSWKGVETRGGESSGRTAVEKTCSYDERRHEARVITARQTRPTTRITQPAWEILGVEPLHGGYGDYTTVAAAFRAQLAELDPATPVRDVTYLGRPAWAARLTEHQLWGWNDQQPVDFVIHWRLVVDKATGLLLAAEPEMEVGGEEFPIKTSLRVTAIEVDPELPDGWQSPEAPRESKVTRVDTETRFGTPDQVAGWSWPTLPLIPQQVPAGYVLTDVAAAPRLRGSYGAGSDVADGVVGPVVLARFRRGFSSFTVQVSPKGFGEWVTPDGSDGPKNVEKVRLSGGYLAGALAETWTGPYGGGGPTLVTNSDRSWVRITGDLTRQELIEVANSMKVYGDVDKPLIPGY